MGVGLGVGVGDGLWVGVWVGWDVNDGIAVGETVLAGVALTARVRDGTYAIMSESAGSALRVDAKAAREMVAVGSPTPATAQDTSKSPANQATDSDNKRTDGLSLIAPRIQLIPYLSDVRTGRFLRRDDGVAEWEVGRRDIAVLGAAGLPDDSFSACRQSPVSSKV